MSARDGMDGTNDPGEGVETDPAALSSAEDLDEDSLSLDPLEEGVEPPERWSAAQRSGTTPFEQRQGETLDERLAEERPDVPGGEPPDETGGIPEAEGERQNADEAGGSVARALRTPRGVGE
ncbi:hypothetical protein BAY61_09095 [Prauserella marina]|uniref:Uncharacterized protein n=1 Tax=Prauserella marina TaxID=530584 RepID=A0A222VMF5_9PSEU|nr:hypothetical protein [Prauserella marina]ASR35110.1 hypothetical protein BAY61_09095 [Prauserella marina]PWV85135.1 hypothetical protein DES30_1011158 [Prauserella marina]SDC03973.1 hypothetical protein SAMN05421630_101180 [Prauserella marina]